MICKFVRVQNSGIFKFIRTPKTLWFLLLIFLFLIIKENRSSAFYDEKYYIRKIFNTDEEAFKRDSQGELFQHIPVSKVKEFWDKKPCNSGWNFPGLQQGTKEWFDAVEERRYTVEPHSYKFAGFESSLGLRVLEIGGGICTDSMSFAKNGADLTIVDLSTESLSLCRKRFEIFGYRAKFFQGSAMQLNTFLPEQKFDVIYSYGVIHHMPEPEKCVCQLKNYLADNGELRIMLYSKFSYKLFQVMRENNLWNFAHLDSIIAKYSEAQTGSPVTYTYTYEEVDRMFQRCGFKVTKMWKDHIFAYDIDKYKKNVLEILPEFQNMLPETFAQMKAELGWHIMIKAEQQ